MKININYQFLIVFLLLQGCAGVAVKPASLEQTLGYAYGQITTIKRIAANLLNRERITKEQGARILKITNQARQDFDGIRVMLKLGQRAQGKTKFDIVTNTLNDLEKYLKSLEENK